VPDKPETTANPEVMPVTAEATETATVGAITVAATAVITAVATARSREFLLFSGFFNG
jgi:hypothetical protein